ncbi:MAG TPA: hypothetical protein PKY77_06040 [Phycisphaerae bacterium]|nr:hypothetical protein [Phycisphaerae bacterium]HRY68994.1 hypothetical protein [Phycisphaerae bacterium]HSA26032.1 hypothetical protein [Phycisphaerae bacterium]
MAEAEGVNIIRENRVGEPVIGGRGLPDPVGRRWSSIATTARSFCPGS